jgi:hypothetical protein
MAGAPLEEARAGHDILNSWDQIVSGRPDTPSSHTRADSHPAHRNPDQDFSRIA